MIKFENTEVVGFEPAIRGMRNPMNSWDKSDSGYCSNIISKKTLACHNCILDRNNCKKCMEDNAFIIGPNDSELMRRLRNAGTDHRKFMRMIVVYVDITAPLYWWKEFETYRVGVAPIPTDIEFNSCSTMHKIHAKEFTLEDFSCEHLMGDGDEELIYVDWVPLHVLEHNIVILNKQRKRYLETKDKKYWWQMIQLLPSSYNQKRTIMMNYEVLANIYKSRKGHKLDEWKEHNDETYYGFCDWIKSLPYSELIAGDFDEKGK